MSALDESTRVRRESCRTDELRPHTFQVIILFGSINGQITKTDLPIKITLYKEMLLPYTKTIASPSGAGSMKSGIDQLRRSARASKCASDRGFPKILL
jgi:hypothetical protein